MSNHKDWGNNERIRRDEHLKGIKYVTKKWTLAPKCKSKHGMNEFKKKKNLPNELVLSAANQLPNCVVRSESGVLCRICVVRSESGFRCRIWLVRSDLGVCCWIGVVRSESGVRCWIRVVRKESGVHAELCCPQRIRCSLSNLCGPQRIRGSLLNCVVCNESGVRCRIMLFAGNQVFAAEFVWFAANQVFATELVWSAAN